jgi:orotidine-5'-phosphate decarboxylase
VIDVAAEHGGGVFVLALTSNPEGGSVQRAIDAGGKTVAQSVIDEISQLNAGVEPLGNFGVVVGATMVDNGHEFTDINGPMLAPGVGAQGGKAADLRRVFGQDLSRVLPSVSREILNAGPSVEALRTVMERELADCRAAISTEG